MAFILSSIMVRYTGHVGKKFHEDGSPRKFPGNTIICHVPKESAQFSFLVDYQNRLKEQSWADKFSFLPPSSFHMTVFEGICDEVRKPRKWISALPLDASLEETDEYLKEKWAKIEKTSGFQMKARFISIGSVITLNLMPKTAEEEKRIRDFRDTLSEQFGIRMPNHNRYGFHISFAYQIEKFNPLEMLKVAIFMWKEKSRVQNGFGILETNTPELTFFEDMTEFASARH